MIWWLTVQALAVTPEVVLARVEEVRPLRAARLDKDAPEVDEAIYRKAAAGQIVTGLESVEGHKAKKVWGVGVMDVPIGAYWAAINDDASKVEWTKLGYVEVVQGRACEAPRRVFQFIEVPLLTDRWWVVAIRANQALQVTSEGRLREQVWSTDGVMETPTESTRTWAAKGMHITSTQGSWFLVDLDGKSTLVEYYTWADPGGSVPAGLASSLAASGVDDTLKRMADLAKAGPRCPTR